MNWKKSSSVFLSFAAVLLFSSLSFGQERPRVVVTEPVSPIKKTISSQPTNLPPTAPQNIAPRTNSISRPTLTNKILVVGASNNYQPAAEPLVKKTVSSTSNGAIPTDAMRRAGALTPSAAAFNQRLSNAMDSKLGIRYVYGSTGPYTYDCSGLVWSVFQEAGLNFERSSARTYWSEFEPVSGDDRYKFGTLVFFNGLGHVGIVVDDKGFYHASSSKGVTYSSFEGYWEKRIVGFRKIPDSMMPYANQSDLLRAESGR